ncbi:hypothetical protein [Pedococcus sp. 5OH_020]|uniref:hypothetical protein n=1 Tax=Pedococcus sp. 5OH_020 TaxID=2989814 RepID=UPI0022E9A57B|nr:hypothetical protein [Pedococcus sp. 5OH_020]
MYAAIDDLVGTVPCHDEWKSAFTLRYIDFTPIQPLLPSLDPRSARLTSPAKTTPLNSKAQITAPRIPSVDPE